MATGRQKILLRPIDMTLSYDLTDFIQEIEHLTNPECRNITVSGWLSEEKLVHSVHCEWQLCVCVSVCVSVCVCSVRKVSVGFHLCNWLNVASEKEETVVFLCEVLNRLADAHDTWYEHVLTYDLLTTLGMNTSWRMTCLRHLVWTRSDVWLAHDTWYEHVLTYDLLTTLGMNTSWRVTCLRHLVWTRSDVWLAAFSDTTWRGTFPLFTFSPKVCKMDRHNFCVTLFGY
jgi:hypothetical protein